jgi:hypothetical protein
VISALERLKQKDHEFEANLCYVVKLCLKKGKKQKSEVIRSIKSSYTLPTGSLLWTGDVAQW